MDIETRNRIESLEGKVLAAYAAIRALIACHPAPERAIETVCEQLDLYAGMALGGEFPDALADAVAKAQNNLLPDDDAIARARRPGRP